MKLESQLAGRFKFEAVNAETGERRLLADWFDNLITDIGLDRIGSNSFLTRCHVGSGSNAPLVTDTGLQTPVAETASAVSSSNGAAAAAPYFGWYRRTFRFAAGVATGNLSEVSISWGAGNSSAFSRALIKEGGIPATITVLATDYLDVTYELRVYAPENDITFQTVIGGVTHNCVARALGVTNSSYWGSYIDQAAAFGAAGAPSAHSGDLADVTAINPNGTPSTGFGTNLAYVPGSLTARATFDWGLTVGNFAGGIKSIRTITSLGLWQCNFTPTIAKPVDNTKSLRLNVYFTWARKTLP